MKWWVVAGVVCSVSLTSLRAQEELPAPQPQPQQPAESQGAKELPPLDQGPSEISSDVETVDPSVPIEQVEQSMKQQQQQRQQTNQDTQPYGQYEDGTSTEQPAETTTEEGQTEQSDPLSQSLDQFQNIYNEMTQNRGYQNRIGHTVAAAHMANSMAEAEAERVAIMQQMIVEIGNSDITLVRNALQRSGDTLATRYPEVTEIAAILAVKRGTRTAREMVQQLSSAYQSLQARNYRDSISNLKVAALLMY